VFVADTSFLDALHKEARPGYRGERRATRRLRALGGARIIVSVVTVGEFLRSRAPAEALAFLSRFPKQPVTLETARRWAAIQGKRGGPLGANDAWIAATALQLGAAVLTGDADYRRAPGLRLAGY